MSDLWTDQEWWDLKADRVALEAALFKRGIIVKGWSNRKPMCVEGTDYDTVQRVASDLLLSSKGKESRKKVRK
jgi:hypothetical protein